MSNDREKEARRTRDASVFFILCAHFDITTITLRYLRYDNIFFICRRRRRGRRSVLGTYHWWAVVKTGILLLCGHFRGIQVFLWKLVVIYHYSLSPSIFIHYQPTARYTVISCQSPLEEKSKQEFEIVFHFSSVEREENWNLIEMVFRSSFWMAAFTHSIDFSSSISSFILLCISGNPKWIERLSPVAWNEISLKCLHKAARASFYCKNPPTSKIIIVGDLYQITAAISQYCLVRILGSLRSKNRPSVLYGKLIELISTHNVDLAIAEFRETVPYGLDRISTMAPKGPRTMTFPRRSLTLDFGHLDA